MVEPKANSQNWSIAPYFLVHDVVSAAEYYRDVLGFHFDRYWGEPPSFCMVKRRGILIMLAQVEDTVALRPNNLCSREGGAWDAYVWVNNVDALHDEFVAKGAHVVSGLCDKEYGCRDFDIVDCNGYRVCFGQDIS